MRRSANFNCIYHIVIFIIILWYRHIQQILWFDLISLFNGKSTFVGYLMTNAFYTVLFQTIPLSKSKLFSSIWPADRNQSDTTTQSQSRPGSGGSKEVLLIPQNSSITGASPPNCFVSNQNTRWGSLTALQKCSFWSSANLANRSTSVILFNP